MRRTIWTLLCVGLLVAPVPMRAQEALPGRTGPSVRAEPGWPEALRPRAGDPVLWLELGPGDRSLELSQDSTRMAPDLFGLTLAVAAGSVLGGLATLLATSWSDDPIRDAAALTGSWLGGALPAAAGTRNTAGAFIGSAAGVLVGSALVNASFGHPLVMYLLGHGVTTSIVARRMAR